MEEAKANDIMFHLEYPYKSLYTLIPSHKNTNWKEFKREAPFLDCREEMDAKALSIICTDLGFFNTDDNCDVRGYVKRNLKRYFWRDDPM